MVPVAYAHIIFTTVLGAGNAQFVHSTRTAHGTPQSVATTTDRQTIHLVTPPPMSHHGIMDSHSASSRCTYCPAPVFAVQIV